MSTVVYSTSMDPTTATLLGMNETQASPIALALDVSVPAKPDAQTAVIPLPESHWEGEIVTLKPDSDDNGLVRARLTFARGHIVGFGLACGQARYGKRHDASFDGELERNNVTLRIWLNTEDLSMIPLVCTGVIDADNTEMSGSWNRKCSATCDCGGASGTFVLRRIDEL